MQLVWFILRNICNCYPSVICPLFCWCLFISLLESDLALAGSDWSRLIPSVVVVTWPVPYQVTGRSGGGRAGLGFVFSTLIGWFKHLKGPDPGQKLHVAFSHLWLYCNCAIEWRRCIFWFLSSSSHSLWFNILWIFIIKANLLFAICWYLEAKFLHPVIEVKMFGTNLESHPLLNAELNL